MAQQIATVEDQLEHQVRQAEDAADSLRRWREELEQASWLARAGKKKAAVENEKLPEADVAFRMCQEKLAETQRRLLLVEQAGRLEESHRDHAGKKPRPARIAPPAAATGARRLVAARHWRIIVPAPAAQKMPPRSFDRNGRCLLRRRTLLEGAGEEKCQLGREVRGFGAAGYSRLKPGLRPAALTAPSRRQREIERVAEQASLDSLPRLWEGIQIEKGWEDALEAVLRERLNSAELERLEYRMSGRMTRRRENGRCSESTGWERKREAREIRPVSRWTVAGTRSWAFDPLQRYLKCDEHELKWCWTNG